MLVSLYFLTAEEGGRTVGYVNRNPTGNTTSPAGNTWSVIAVCEAKPKLGSKYKARIVFNEKLKLEKKASAEYKTDDDFILCEGATVIAKGKVL